MITIILLWILWFLNVSKGIKRGAGEPMFYMQKVSTL